MNTKTNSLEGLSAWLAAVKHSTLSEDVLRIGEVTGWRHWGDRQFGASNFERGLLLHRLVELTAAKDVLELGTGRGFASICMGMASVTYKLNMRITTIDPIGPENNQEWPVRLSILPANLGPMA